MAPGARRWSARMVGRLWWSPLVLVGVLVDRGSRGRWFLTPAVVVLAACASTAGKLVIRRPRPGSARRISPLGGLGGLGAAGFPSTHTACAFAIAGWLRGSRRGRWLHLVAVGIGYLRVRRRAHYYGDVAAGAILGYGIAWRLDGAWSRLLSTRATRAERAAGEPRAGGAPEPRSVDRLGSRRGSPRPYLYRPVPAEGEEWSQRAARRRGAGMTRERLAAIASALAVR
jgi:membrane-associated phospholipid phosphatase